MSQITVAQVQQYTTNVAMLLQQSGSRLRGSVMEHAFVGKAAMMLEQFGSVTATRNPTRHSDTPVIPTPQDRRWIYPNDRIWADLVDDEDRLRLLIDPMGPFSTAGSNALGRGIDDEIIYGMLNANMTGENGTTSTGLLSAYNSGSQVIASTVGGAAACGMNIAKLRTAKKALMLAEVDVDNEQLFVAISATQHDQLLNETQAINLDYTTRPVLEDGRIRSFMGFNFILTERIPGAANFDTVINSAVTGYTTGSLWLCPFWAKSGVTLGVWNDISASVDKRPDKNNAMQILVKGTFGGARTEEKRVGLITCV